MHVYTKKLLNKVNNKLKENPLVYFSRDIERGLGLEGLLKNYYLVSVEDSYIIDQLNTKKERAFSLSRKGYRLKTNSTQELINHHATSEWIKKTLKRKEFFAQLFQFNQSAIFSVEKLGGSVLNNPATLNRKYEDKISQFQILKNNEIPIPKSEIIIVKKITLEEQIKSLSFNIKIERGKPLFIAQLGRAHTGSGTFFIKNADDWFFFIKQFEGNEVKISEYIEGESYTINGCVTKKGVFVAGLQYQITGVRDLTDGLGTTVGNDFSYANKLRQNLKTKIFEVTKQIGELMKVDGFKGLFGLDIVVRDNEIYIIEINARQTANIPFQTKLEILQNKVPLSLINLAEWLDIEIEFDLFEEIAHLEGSQVFLRSRTDDLIISDSIKSGIYRLQSDNAVKLAKDEDVILLDEEGDKPLIWQHEGYCIEDINNGGFVLLVQKRGNKRDKYDEIARMQFKHQIMINQGNKLIVSPWVLESMREIKERVS